MEADYFSNNFNIKSYYNSLQSANLEDIQNYLKYFENDAYLSIIN